MSRIVESLYQKYGLNEGIKAWDVFHGTSYGDSYIDDYARQEYINSIASNSTLKDNVKEIVCIQNSDDPLCQDINPDITFQDVLDALNNDEDVYDVIGVDDSIIREYVFSALTDVLHCDYDDVYMRWLGKGPKIEECYDISKQNLTEANSEDVKQLLHKFKSDFVEIMKYVGTPKLVGYRRLLDKMINEIAIQNGITESIHNNINEDLEDVPEDLYTETWNYVEYLIRGYIRNTITPGRIADFVDGYNVSWAKNEYDISSEVWSEDIEPLVQSIMEELFVGYPDEE